MSVQSELPCVHSAVEKLQELADRMKSDNFRFRPQDVANIGNVIDALYQLEAERNTTHESLEKAAITADRFRHVLKGLPKTTAEDETCCIARQSVRDDAKIMEKQLQEELTRKRNNCAELDSMSSVLEAENDLLSAERDALKRQYEDLLSEASDRMAERFHEQGELNLLNSELEEITQSVIHLEDSLISLKASTLRERKQMRKEKKDLEKTVQDTEEALRQQTEVNKQKAKDLDVCRALLLPSKARVLDVRDMIKLSEKQKADLERTTESLEEELAMKLQKTDRLRAADTEQERKKEVEHFEDEEKQLLDNIEQHKDELIPDAHFRNSRLNMKAGLLQRNLLEKEKWAARAAKRLVDTTAKLQAKSKELESEEGRLRSVFAKQAEMHRERERKAEEHSRACAAYKQIKAGFQKMLNRVLVGKSEREERAARVAELLSEAQEELCKIETFIHETEKWGWYYQQKYTNEANKIGKHVKTSALRRQAFLQQFTAAERNCKDEQAGIQFKLLTLNLGLETTKAILSKKRGKLQELQLIREGRRRMLDLESKADDDDEVYRLLVGHDLRIGSVTEPLWWGFDEDMLAELIKIRRAYMDSESDVEGFSGIDALMWMTPEQLECFLREVRLTKSQEKALRWILFTPEEREYVQSTEQSIQDKKQKLAQAGTNAQMLQEDLRQRTEKFDQCETVLNLMKPQVQILQDEVKKCRESLYLAKAPQPFLRKELKTKRAVYLEQMKEQAEVTKAIEQDIFKVGCKLRFLVDENDKLERSCKKTEDGLAETQSRLASEKETIACLRAEEISEKEELSKMRADSAMKLKLFSSGGKETADSLIRLRGSAENNAKQLELKVEQLKANIKQLTDKAAVLGIPTFDEKNQPKDKSKHEKTNDVPSGGELPKNLYTAVGSAIESQAFRNPLSKENKVSGQSGEEVPTYPKAAVVSQTSQTSQSTKVSLQSGEEIQISPEAAVGGTVETETSQGPRSTEHGVNQQSGASCSLPSIHTVPEPPPVTGGNVIAKCTSRHVTFLPTLVSSRRTLTFLGHASTDTDPKPAELTSCSSILAHPLSSKGNTLSRRGACIPSRHDHVSKRGTLAPRPPTTPGQRSSRNESATGKEKKS